MALARRSDGVPTPCTSSGNATMDATVRRGLSEEYGSWNTGWMRRASSSRPRVTMSWPSMKIMPALGGVSPSSMRASVDLPQPDSPTMPSTPPRSTLRSTPLTACSFWRG